MQEIVSQIIDAARQGYGESFPEDLDQARRHETGDSLADFIMLELYEGLDGDHYESKIDAVNRAISLMETAQDDIQRVINAITRG